MPTESEVRGTGVRADDTRPVLGQASGLGKGWHVVSVTFRQLAGGGGGGGGASGMEVYGVRMVMGNGQTG